jgi:hypothetical protein
VNGGATLAFLQCAATAILLSFAARGAARYGAGLFLLCALAASFVGAAEGWTPMLLIATAGSVVACALPIHLKNGVPAGLAIALPICTGLLAGISLASSSSRTGLAVLPVILLFLVGQWLVSKGYGIVPKVASAWLVAISMLAAALPLVAMPGYVADHMD